MTVEHGEEAPFLQADRSEAQERSEEIIHGKLIILFKPPHIAHDRPF